ncbi:bifunctional pyridoxal-dependent enzyme with beta-cystathionase and maltose regulon repressor activities [Paraburkholderia sp. MM5482-R2]
MFVENGDCRVRLSLACPQAQLPRSLEKIRDAIAGFREGQFTPIVGQI